MGSNLLMYVKSFLLNLKNFLLSNSTLRKSKKIKYIKRFMWGVGGRKGMDWEIGISRCKLLYIEWINNKVLVYSTGNYIQYYVITYQGKESQKVYIHKSVCVCMCVYTHMYITNRCAIHLKLTWYCKSTILQLKKWEKRNISHVI